jgi:rare lipoprotein A
MEITILAVFGTAIAYSSSSSADEYGKAAFYNNPLRHGLIAAPRTLPFGTHVRFTDLDKRRSAVAAIVERRPFIRGRVIDVATTAADARGIRPTGVARGSEAASSAAVRREANCLGISRDRPAAPCRLTRSGPNFRLQATVARSPGPESPPRPRKC